VNFIAVFLLFFNIFSKDYYNTQFWSIQTWIAIFIWYRFLIKLRIFPAFGWLVRMFIACIWDMRIFMAILVVGVFAFADAFFSIDKILELKGLIEAAEIPEDQTTYEKYW